MAIWNPSMKLLAVMHVGSLSGVVRSTSETPQLEPLNNKYELYGPAISVCRQIMTQTAWMTEPYMVKVTKDAADEGGVFASMKLIQASTCYTVSSGNTDRHFLKLTIIWL